MVVLFWCTGCGPFSPLLLHLHLRNTPFSLGPTEGTFRGYPIKPYCNPRAGLSPILTCNCVRAGGQCKGNYRFLIIYSSELLFYNVPRSENWSYSNLLLHTHTITRSRKDKHMNETNVLKSTSLSFTLLRCILSRSPRPAILPPKVIILRSRTNTHVLV